MTSIVILNVVFAVLVVGGIVGLLGRAIIADKPDPRPSRRPLPEDRRATRERTRRPRSADRVTPGV